MKITEQDKLFDYILSDELTWEGLIRDIVREERMNPWDIDVGRLAVKYSGRIKNTINIDFRTSGKFLLTASILLKMKSDYLLKDLEEKGSDEGILLSFIFKDLDYHFKTARGELIPKIPMMKKRRVTLQELIAALKKAVEVNERRIARQRENKRSIRLNIKKIDLPEKIIEVYSKITMFFKNLKKEEITFKELLPSNDKFDIIWTFMPLLYLNNEGKIMLRQEELFGEIYIRKP